MSESDSESDPSSNDDRQDAAGQDLDASSDEDGIELLPVDWTALRPHMMRQALFIVAETIHLEIVARAVRDDDAEKVEGWIEDGTIARPTPEQVETWDAEPSGAKFMFAILQPWVLAQPRPARTLH